MSVTKKVMIDEKEVIFRASAAIPRLYRMQFHRDIYRDFAALSKDVKEGNPNASSLDSFSLQTFEDIAYLMAKHADPTIPDTPEDWLDQFSTFSIYQVLPKLIDLWGMNVETEVDAKKTMCHRTGNDNPALSPAMRPARYLNLRP